jgi:sn-glycerol 3-phosphate transport system permease protein
MKRTPGNSNTRHTRRRELWEPVLFLAPAIAFSLIWTCWPLLIVGRLSLYSWNFVSPTANFVGLENYRELFADEVFRKAVANTVAYVAIALVSNALLPLGLALLTLMVGPRAQQVYQTALFAPTAVAVSVGSLVWVWIYTPAGGLLNELTGLIDLPARSWLSDPDAALGAVAAVGAWKFLGFNYLLFLAGLRAIPREQLEAAAMDGASGLALLSRVILPLLAPTTVFVAVSSVIGAMQNVMVPTEVLTKGGPSNSTTSLLYLLYAEGFQFFRVGTSAAVTVITLVVFLGVAVVQFRLLERKASYDR